MIFCSNFKVNSLAPGWLAILRVFLQSGCVKGHSIAMLLCSQLGL